MSKKAKYHPPESKPDVPVATNFAPMRVNASAVVGLLRHEWEKRHNEGDVIGLAPAIISGLTDEQVLAIAKGTATLEGCTPGPITYLETP